VSTRPARLMIALVLAAGTLVLLNPTPATHPRHTAPRPASMPRPSRASIARAQVASREFLDAYLPYLHGRAPGRSIRAAARPLRTRLAARPPVVSPAMRARTPRVVSITPAGALTVTATVNDGELASYELTLQLTETRGRLLVASVEGAQ
jgi:hypothetical protein